MSKDDKKLPEESTKDDVTSRRELLAATAKLSAFISAVGLTGMGLSEAAEASSAVRNERMLRTPMHKVRPKRGRRQLLLPAVQKRQMKMMLNEALRTGDSRLALKRHPNLKLTRGQQAALKRMTRQDWAALRRAQAKLRPLQNSFASSSQSGDNGFIFW